MKKLVSVLVIVLSLINYSHAQTTETLTNSIIIKMVKANLSDDLIIDEINSSRVNFNISSEAIKLLSNEKVSSRIIEAMKTADSTQPLAESAPSATPTPLPALELPKEKISTESSDNYPAAKSTITVDAISYVIPVEELITFFDKEFTSLTGAIQGWDQRIRKFLEKGDQVKETIRQAEKELADKKNADSKGFTNEIIQLKNKLSKHRESYKQFESNMLADGLKITKEVKDKADETDRSINKRFSEVSQLVRKTDPNPTVDETPKSLTITKQKIGDNFVNYINPVTEMLICYQNEITSIREIIVLWNEKVVAINQKDSELSKKLEPLKKELADYQLNPKVNKKEISALKKQCSNLDKERKLLSQQMADDSKDLSKSLSQICKEFQSSVKERFSDIIENINYSYQNNF